MIGRLVSWLFPNHITMCSLEEAMAPYMEYSHFEFEDDRGPMEFEEEEWVRERSKFTYQAEGAR